MTAELPTTFKKRLGMNGKKWWVGFALLFFAQYLALMTWLVSGQMQDNIFRANGIRFTQEHFEAWKAQHAEQHSHLPPQRTQAQLDRIEANQTLMRAAQASAQAQIESYSRILMNHIENHKP